MENLLDLIEENNGKLLLKFSAKWCGPCKRYAPIFDDFTIENPDVKSFSIDCDEFPDIAQKFSVMSIPCTIVLDNKNEVKREYGILQKNEIQKLLE